MAINNDSVKQDLKLQGLKLIENIETEDFIYAIEKYPSIWDSRTEDYSNRTIKSNSWNSILKSFIPDFEEKSLTERNVLVTIVQKKWKGIRSSYARELRRKKNLKSGSGASRHTEYIYFEQLRFLETILKNTINSLNETGTDDPEVVNEDVTYIGDSDPTLGSSQENIKPTFSSKRRRNNGDAELISILKKRIVLDEKSSTDIDETDEDKLFLLSLVSEIHKVPPEKKLQLRSDTISTIVAAQLPFPQQCPPSIFPIIQHLPHYSPAPTTQ